VNRRRALLLIATIAVIIMVPLTVSTASIANDRLRESNARAAAQSFGDPVGREVVEVTTRSGIVNVTMEGPLPVPDAAPLRAQLEANDVAPADVRVEFIPVVIVEFD